LQSRIGGYGNRTLAVDDIHGTHYLFGSWIHPTTRGTTAAHHHGKDSFFETPATQVFILLPYYSIVSSAISAISITSFSRRGAVLVVNILFASEPSSIV